jgi:hypothetical protein
VLTRAAGGVIRTATYEGVDFLHAPAFEDALERLVLGFLGGEPGIGQPC